MFRKRGELQLVVVCALGALLAADAAWAGPVVRLLSNGQVLESPAYAYVGHGYDYDVSPGDNDMPWLRQYAEGHAIFAGIDMGADWKDREWAMIRAIIEHTANSMTWTGGNSIPQVSYRAREILTHVQNSPSANWGCAYVSAAAIGLAQAQGIPARFTGGISEYSGGHDNCLEVFSTRYNRWIFLFPHAAAWIEAEGVGPLGARELHPYDVAGGILIQYVSVPGVGTQRWAVDYPPLVFMPSVSSHAPIWPYASTKWWSGYFWHMRMSYASKFNCPRNLPANPWNLKFIVTNQHAQDVYGFNPPVPIVDFQDLDLNYPLNNVQAQVQLAGADVQIQLTHNMFEFAAYEMRLDNGEWEPFTLPLADPPQEGFVWSPDGDSRLALRGVNAAGVHSPDVVIDFVNLPCCDADEDGDIDLDDHAILANCMNGPAAVPNPLSPLTAQDCLDLVDDNGDGFVDLRDQAAFQIGFGLD